MNAHLGTGLGEGIESSSSGPSVWIRYGVKREGGWTFGPGHGASEPQIWYPLRYEWHGPSTRTVR